MLAVPEPLHSDPAELVGDAGPPAWGAMPDARSPIQHQVVLHRRDPEQGIARYYSLMIERDLFGRVVLVRNWGRIGANGRELVEEFADEIGAGQALARAKRRRGYRDL